MAGTDFGALLRHWREARRFSQLDLALQADVSSKHISFLETGRNRPSREMILRLTQAMDVPLRDRNTLLNSAGFAPAYRESAMDAPFVGQAEEALERILEKQEPFPAIVLDADWNLVRRNHGAAAFASFLLPGAPGDAFNVLELLFSRDGLQPLIANWEQLSSTLLMRLWRETLSPDCSDYRRNLFEALARSPATPPTWRNIAAELPSGPTVDLVVVKGGRRFSFFTTVTTFGTPQDVTLQELRIESYFPSDEASRALCASWT
jgi:transcriptional regulator with XRE-family HTH domain